MFSVVFGLLFSNFFQIFHSFSKKRLKFFRISLKKNIRYKYITHTRCFALLSLLLPFGGGGGGISGGIIK